MKKIYVNKTDSAALIVEKIINSADKEVVLYVPRFAEIKKKKENFQLLKREAKSVGKTITIESVDEDTLEFANLIGIEAINPFFGRSKRSFSDIVGKNENQDIKKSSKLRTAGSPVGGERAGVLSKIADGEVQKKRFNFKKFLLSLLIILFIAVGVMAAVIYLPQAKMSLVFEKINWDFAGSVVVDIKLKQAEGVADQIKLPGVIIKESKNLTKAYAATGKENVEKSATGEVIIYNAFSSASQYLVKNTRLSAPDGKIFKITKAVTVPGASVVSGKIIPSSVSVVAIAEKPGDSYNIGPVSRFQIPGFMNTSKYETFYAESKEAMTGGFIGEIKVPVKSDISKAQEETKKALEDALKAQVFLGLPKDIKILDNVSQFVVTKEIIGEEADNNGNFLVTEYGEFKIFGFKEEDLIAFLAARLAEESKVDLVLKDYTLEYSSPQMDFSKGEMQLTMNMKSAWVKPFDLEEFKANAVGKNEMDLKKMIFTIPGIKSADVRFWPIWVRTVPKNFNKINIDVEYKI